MAELAPQNGEVSGPVRSGNERAETLRRLKSVEGHIRGIARMVEQDAYCVDVVNQVLAVQRALSKVSALVLDRHLHTCLTQAIRGEDADERERVIGEIMQVFEARERV